MAKTPGTFEEKLARLNAEETELVSYDPAWPNVFENERSHLLKVLPGGSVNRIGHFGSTAVPGLSAKPIIDILEEVVDLEDVKTRIAPLLESFG